MAPADPSDERRDDLATGQGDYRTEDVPKRVGSNGPAHLIFINSVILHVPDG